MKLSVLAAAGALIALSGCVAPAPYDPIGGKPTIARQSALKANGGYVGGPAGQHTRSH